MPFHQPNLIGEAMLFSAVVKFQKQNIVDTLSATT